MTVTLTGPEIQAYVKLMDGIGYKHTKFIDEVSHHHDPWWYKPLPNGDVEAISVEELPDDVLEIALESAIKTMRAVCKRKGIKSEILGV